MEERPKVETIVQQGPRDFHIVHIIVPPMFIVTSTVVITMIITMITTNIIMFST